MDLGAVDCDKAEREERRKIKRAAAARAKRAAAGATPRAQSITATSHGSKTAFRRAAHGSGTASARVSKIRGQQLLLLLLCWSRICDRTRSARIAIEDRGGRR